MQSAWARSRTGKRWKREYESSPERRAKRLQYLQTARGKRFRKFRQARARQKYWQRAKAYVRLLKLRLGCKHCGFREHFAALEFHHRKRTRKIFEIATAISKCINFERVQQEIKKCDVLCSNCHRILTFKEKQHEQQRQ